MLQKTTLTGIERTFSSGDIIVSKTDLKGRLTYANETFMDISGYTEAELLGQPHSILRHPGMPRAIFKLMWATIEAGQEIFAYVVNTCKNGDHYWVQAHVTPSFDMQGQIVGYHSNRRVPDRQTLEKHIMPLYQSLLKEEHQYSNRKDGMNAAYKSVVKLLDDKGVGYDEFIQSL